MKFQKKYVASRNQQEKIVQVQVLVRFIRVTRLSAVVD